MEQKKRGRKNVGLVENGIRVPVLLAPDEHAAFKEACDGRPMAGVLRALAADFVSSAEYMKVGGVG